MKGGKKGDTDKEKKENPWIHVRSSSKGCKAFVQGQPGREDEVEGKNSIHVQYRNDNSKSKGIQLQHQARRFTFHRSTVTYGSANGEYYTSSTTRATGSDGVTFVESKEAETAARQAKHRISSGLHNKGHSATRKLNSDGKVETMQTLPNHEVDELLRFEQSWKGNDTPSLAENFIGYDNIDEADEVAEFEQSKADEFRRFEQSWKGNDTPGLSENFIGYDNIDEADEIAGFGQSEANEPSGFEQSWMGNDSPGWSENFDGYDNIDDIEEPYTPHDYYP
ncbi:uncharacterized protein LOC133853681 isoform X2 [Alnus glutinosa]|uniref:uncharacterized protein LOC133853681 isoform X2 n=1 Tax=Alnus glutinosa TaxID=3517 RepID=UPI002D7A1650|nr:uncharacterized protein LOC133853681 isoform X2 [Alnus glutinosa]